MREMKMYGTLMGLVSFLLLHLFLFGKNVLCEEYRITKASELIDLSNAVNSRTYFSGTTVFLDSDIDFSGESLEPIGNYSSILVYFLGTFDGQGHTISNLKMNSSARFVGLFGYSEGATIKNIVMDSSSSITNSLASSSDKTTVAGIIGYCHSSETPCIVENAVNMASAHFNGNTNGNTFLGGIAGYLSYSSSHAVIVKNCANYGSVTHTGTGKWTYIGGIVGYLFGSLTRITYIQNCLNYGTLTSNNTKSSSQYIGGIVGCTYYTTIDNCVSAGKFVSKYPPEYIGGIVGYADSLEVSHCYWDKEVNESGHDNTGPTLFFYGFSFDSATFELSESISVGNYTGTSLIEVLNAYSDYYYLRDYSKWLLNKDIKGVSFTINGKTSITLNTQIILLPSLSNEGRLWFDKWYTDPSCTLPLTSFEITANKDLHGKWEENTNSYTITFDTKGGNSIDPITKQFGSVIDLPINAGRDNCVIGFWENDDGDVVPWNFIVPAHDLTLHAVWSCTRISSASDLVDFSNIVNSKIDYFDGVTVFLDSDIVFTDDLSKKFEPIGRDGNRYFFGTFDGQGHTINNLKMASFYRYSGLFGFLRGSTIRNVVLDSSCSNTNSYVSSSMSAFTGGFIGECYSNERQFVIEGVVNMAAIVFKGNIGRSNLYLGGIAGYLDSSIQEASVKNCANYGSVTHIGASGWSYIGGVTGAINGRAPFFYPIVNCLNYGTLVYNNTRFNNHHIGGIAGEFREAIIENCVSAGKISSNRLAGYIGGVTSSVSLSQISNCFWDKDIAESGYEIIRLPIISNVSSFDSATFELSESISIGNYTGTSLIKVLNAYSDYYYLRDYSKWLLNKDNKDVSFTINGKTSITLNTQIILLPSLSNEGRLWFDKWYTDPSCTLPLTSFEITANKDLHGKWEENTNSYTITFDTKGGNSIDPITAQFLTVVSLPNGTQKENCEFGIWENDYGEVIPWNFTVPAHDLTLHAVWSCTRISSASDLVDLSKIVNSDVNNFNGKTVYLDSDIVFTYELSKRFEPIGENSNKKFIGTFDGQGHIISNLKMKLYSEYTGLFGYSGGSTIKNVVLDSSCSAGSIASFLSSTYYVGGIIGNCQSEDNPCTIENTVNMAGLFFNGTTSTTFYVGGIAGSFVCTGYEIAIRNCANYGSIENYGQPEEATAGGIVGLVGGTIDTFKGVQNSFNYGRIESTNNQTGTIYIGGIAGSSMISILTNCLSAGKINSTGNATGGIVGLDIYHTNVTHSFWTNEVWSGNSTGMNNPEAPTIEPDASNLTSPTDALVDLNSQVASNSGWSKWFTLHLNGGRINNLEQEELIVAAEPFPDPAKIENSFLCWCTDSNCNGRYDYKATDVSGITDLYAHFVINNYTVTFVSDGTVIKSEILDFGSTIAYPDNPSKAGYTFIGWDNDVKTVPGHDITITAQWMINNYTVTFVSDGTVIKSEILDYRSTIAYPDNPSKAGYTFIGWDNDVQTVPGHDITVTAQWSINNYVVTFILNNGNEPLVRTLAYNTTIEYPTDVAKEGYTFNGWDRIIGVVPAENLTITAQWVEKPMEYVKIVFGKKDMSEEEVKEVIRRYTNDDFVIETIGFDESAGETVVVIKFVDPAKTTEFVRNINKHGRESVNFIRKANGIDFEGSFSPIISSPSLFNILLI